MAAFALYTAIGVVRYDTGLAGNYDLGIFSQAAQRWSEGRLAGSAIRGLDNLFADHFSPITALFGVAWRIWSDPRALIITQALALAVAVLVVGVAAAPRLPRPLTAAVLTGAVLAKGMISASVFVVHETGLGTPLVAGLCWGLLDRRRGLVVGCALGTLLVKEDLGVTVIVAGLLWWALTGERHTGLLLAGAGVIGLVVALAVVVAVNPEHTSPYLQFLGGASGSPQGLTGTGITGGHRWEPAVLFAATAGVVGLRSPIAALALPTLAWRAASSNTAYWQTYFHYDVVLVPIAVVALVDVLSRPGASRSWRAPVALAGLAFSAALGVFELTASPLTDPSAYRPSPPVSAAASLGRLLPPGSPVAAQQGLGPVLVARLDVRTLSPLPAGPVRAVVLTPTGSSFGASESAKQTWLAQQRARPGVLVTEQDGVLLVRLPTPEVVQLPGDVSGPPP